jgi:hypothetical protein
MTIQIWVDGKIAKYVNFFRYLCEVAYGPRMSDHSCRS